MKKITVAIIVIVQVSLSFGTSTSLDIRNIVNFGLSDNGVARDGKGGFTDDGFNLGEIIYNNGVNKVFDSSFDLIDPAQNNGKAVLTFECTSSKTGLRKAVLDLRGKNIKGEALALLHSSTKSPDVRYTKIGAIEIFYADKTSHKIELNYAIDVMNGRAPQTRANAKIWRPANGDFGYFFSRFMIPAKRIDRIEFYTRDIATWLVAAVSIEDKFPSWTAGSDEWIEVDMSKIAIADGSALDVSKDFPDAHSGELGRVILSKRGNFAFEKRPNSKIKFHGTVWYMGGELGTDDAETKRNLSELCKVAKRQGYNLLRFHATDFLCSRNPDKVARGFDLYDWFISEAKKNGIYLCLLVGNNDINGDGFKWDDRFSLKMKMILGDAKTRQQWREYSKMQLEHINPYTGLAWKDDPVFMGMEYWNEMGLFMVYSNIDDSTKKLMDAEFQKYLQEKYGDISTLAKSGKLIKKNYASFSRISCENERKSSDWANFLRAKNDSFREYCENVFRNEIGYRGLVYQYNAIRETIFTLMSSETADFLSHNIYHCHPSGFNSIGSTVNPKSSLGEAAAAMRGGMCRRSADRPMTYTEYNHCHWNPRKYEGGSVFGAYSALQGFGAMVVHCNGVKSGNRKNNFLDSFSVCNSPVFRANEFLVYCMFMRGDVKKSPHRVELFFPKNYVENSPLMNSTMGDSQTRISLLCGFTSRFEGARVPKLPSKTKVKNPDITIEPVGASSVLTAANFSTATSSFGDSFDLEGFCSRMREKGILPQENITSPSMGVYQSDTGEITLNAKEEWISVVSPKTEAAAFKKGKFELPSLSKISSTQPCCVGICAMDGAPIPESRRLVLVYATDNINADMRLDTSRVVLIKNARNNSKVLIRRATLEADFKLPSVSENWKLYALAVNGSRIAEIPVKIADGSMKFSIDTLKYPTTFFEIVAK